MAEFILNLIDVTGLEIDAKRVNRLVREAKAIARDCGASFARKMVRDTINGWERVAVLNYLANNRQKIQLTPLDNQGE